MQPENRELLICAACGKKLRTGEGVEFRDGQMFHLDCAMPFLWSESEKHAA